MKEKKKKSEYIDDGHTVYNMDNVPQPFWKPTGKDKNVGLSKKERRAAIKAAFAAYFPIFATVVCCFGIVAILIYLWLK